MASTSYAAIYSFGDSLSDAGDAYLLTSEYGTLLGTSAEPVNPPYDQESYGGVRADVFSNGTVWVQDLATALGLATPGPGQVGGTGNQLIAAGIPAIVADGLDGGNGNAYVTLVSATANGTDFAIGGSVTGPTNFNTSGASALTDLQSQIANFQNQIVTPSPTALYTVWSGSNDVLDLLTSSTFQTQSATTSQGEVAQSAQNEVNAVEELAGLGAKTILVANVPDLGLIPEITSLGTEASATASAYAQYFNIELETDLQTAGGTLSADGTTIDLLNTYGLISNTSAGTVVPGPNGGTITNITSAAYTGSFTSSGTNTEVSNPDNYLFFDMLHPTQTGHQAIANLAYSELAAACYCAGTRIRTPSGDVAVEGLREGDAVLTASGIARPIRWIGRRRYAGRFLLRNGAMLPVRFAAGSLGGGLPERDLFVSPEHAMAIDGWLIPARELVNGTTITRVPAAGVVHYIHVELDRHDVLLAEGAPSESFVDDDSRGSFENAFDYWGRFGRTPGGPAQFCLPRLTEGHELDAIRQRLDTARAA
jgi:phospholipase/lecithinase/hemolysin